MNTTSHDMKNSPLGKTVAYSNIYNADLLFAIPRKTKRDQIQVPTPLPFKGIDIWNSFEFSWLNTKGKPVISILEVVVPCDSPNIFEAKSFKLYLNSFHQTKFDSQAILRELLIKDLSAITQSDVKVTIWALTAITQSPLNHFKGLCLDDLDISCDIYNVDPTLLTTSSEAVTETVYSDLLKSNCLMTEQPDWGSIQISYSGAKINHEGLLRYLVSFRNHTEFQEQCIERIFMDITRQCAPATLSVYARYTRRGGIDINPFRSTENDLPVNNRLGRQ